MTGYRVVTTAEDRAEMVAELLGRAVAVDVETVGLDPWSPSSRLRMVQLGACPGRVWIDHRPGEAVREILAAAPAVWGHNAVYDLTWLHHLGLVDLDEVMRRVHDTMILAFLADNRPRAVPPRRDDEDEWDEAVRVEDQDDTAPGHALKDLAVHHLGPDADLAERVLYAERNLPTRGTRAWARAWADLDDHDPLLLDYAATDIDLVLRLRRRLAPADEEVFGVERRVAAVAARMQARGFLIDTDQVEVARRWARTEEAYVWPRLRALGITSSAATGRGRDQLIRVLEEAGAPLTMRTASGATSLAREVLEGLALQGYEPADLVHRARRARRFQDDYLRKMIDNRGSDGRLRPSIKTLGARTGRWSIGGALPMQQMPRTGGFRECFLAEPGQVLVGADYSSIEFHTLGVLAGDEAMLAVTETGADPYVATAEVLWPDTEITKVLRNSAKPFNLGLGYGMGPATLAMKTGRTLAEARRLRTKLQARWPGPSRLMRRIGSAYYGGRRELPTMFGRVLRIPEKDGRAIQHMALNHANQGTARDLMCRDLLHVVDAGLDPWLSIHDEVLVSVDAADAEDALRTLLSTMNHDRHEVLGIPIRADGAILGPRWRKL